MAEILVKFPTGLKNIESVVSNPRSRLATLLAEWSKRGIPALAPLRAEA